MQPNTRQRLDAMSLLCAIPAATAAVVVFDPQYREVLDKLAYGNEGARQKKRAELPSMSPEVIRGAITEAYRVLKPSGHLLLWTDKFNVAEGIGRWVGHTPFLVVDLIAWDKDRIGMGSRTRAVTEYLVICQKPPKRAKEYWPDRAIRDTHREKAPKDRIHPHAKPYELQYRILKGMTQPGDLVVDPAAGSYGILSICQQLGREFLGCDITG